MISYYHFWYSYNILNKSVFHTNSFVTFLCPLQRRCCMLLCSFMLVSWASAPFAATNWKNTLPYRSTSNLVCWYISVCRRSQLLGRYLVKSQCHFGLYCFQGGISVPQTYLTTPSIERLWDHTVFVFSVVNFNLGYNFLSCDRNGISNKGQYLADEKKCQPSKC